MWLVGLRVVRFCDALDGWANFSFVVGFGGFGFLVWVAGGFGCSDGCELACVVVRVAWHVCWFEWFCLVISRFEVLWMVVGVWCGGFGILGLCGLFWVYCC